MSSQIGSISSTSAGSTASSTSSSSSSSAPKLTDETKKQLQDLGVDTTNITTEAQGQIALLQAQQQTQGGEKHHSCGGKAEMESLKAEATSLAGKVGVQVSSNEKLSDIIAAIGPAIDAKVSAAGNDQAKISEAQELQTEYASLSSSLSNMQAQHAQSAQGSQGEQAINSSLNNMATQNKLYHQV